METTLVPHILDSWTFNDLVKKAETTANYLIRSEPHLQSLEGSEDGQLVNKF